MPPHYSSPEFTFVLFTLSAFRPFSLVPLSISTFLALEPRGVASLERALTPPLGTLFGYVNQYVSVTGFLPITLRTDAAENVPIIMGHERSQ